MIQTVINHKVKDFEKWKKVFDEFTPERKKMGEVSYSVGRAKNNPSNVFVINEWNSMESFNKFMQSPNLKEAMQKAGVMEEPHVAVLQEVAKGVV